MSSPCDPKSRTTGSPSLLWPPHPSWKLCWHQCTESLLPRTPSWTNPALREKKNPKMLFLQCALYSVRKTQKQRLHNSRTNLKGFRNGNYWLWKHWLSRQSSTNYPDPFFLISPVILSGYFAIKATQALTFIGSTCFRGPREHIFCYMTPTGVWTPPGRCLRTEKKAKNLHCGFAAQISRENRHVPQPLWGCSVGAAWPEAESPHPVLAAQGTQLKSILHWTRSQLGINSSWVDGQPLRGGLPPFHGITQLRPDWAPLQQRRLLRPWAIWNLRYLEEFWFTQALISYDST